MNRIKRIKHWFKKWLESQKEGTVLISYPKCGRTWLRLMIGCAIAEHFGIEKDQNIDQILELDDLHKTHTKAPRINVVHDDDAFFKVPSELQTTKQEFRNKKVIFLVRDPRDVVVSSYFEKTKRKYFKPDDTRLKPHSRYEGTISSFLREPRGSLQTVVKYYDIWKLNRNRPKKFMIVRYEDLRSDPHGQLKRILEFMDLRDVSPATMEHAVEFASFDKMRQMEKSGRFKEVKMRPANQGDLDSYKTRKGKVGGFVEYLSEEDQRYAASQLSENVMGFYGYAGNA